MSECKRIQQLLALRPADRSAEDRRRIEAHVAHCACCAALDQAYAWQNHLLHALSAASLTPRRRGALTARTQHARRRHEMRKRWLGALAGVAGIVVCVGLLVGLKLLVPPDDSLSVASEPPTANPGSLPDLPAWESLPITICRRSETWVRPGEEEQAREVWNREPIPQVIQWWTFRQNFYRYRGGNSEFYHAWPAHGLWTSDAPYTCDPDTRELWTGKELELWLLQHEALSAHRLGNVYFIGVRPVDAGYEMIRLPGPEDPDAEPEIRFIDEMGNLVDSLPKPPPWNDPDIPERDEMLTVQGRVVENDTVTRIVTLRDDAGQTWSVPWIEGTILVHADGSPAAFADLQPGVTVEVSGVERWREPPRTLSAIRVIVH